MAATSTPTNLTFLDSSTFNATPTSMANPNAPTIPNINDLEGSYEGHVLEAYTVVLSVTCHLLSTLFGGSSSVAVIAAILHRGNINKYSYLVVLSFLTACCILNFVYSPMEMGDLLIYHSSHVHPSRNYVAVKTIAFFLLVAFINVVIIFLSVEGLLRMANRFGRLLQKAWPGVATVTACLTAAILTAILLGPLVLHSGVQEGSYVMMEQDVRVTFLSLLIFLLSTALLAFIILLVQMARKNFYWEDGRPHVKKKNLKLEIPEFLISQSNNACEDMESGYDLDQSSRTASPSTPKLLTVGDQQIIGEDATPIPELSKNKQNKNVSPKPMGNRLGINMSQVLGRRRHTICQISDSSSPTTAPPDPINKAKQYNYVRKFSVDISALQAQLQNPKIFKEAPFQSDIDLTRKAASEANKPLPPKPLQPLKPFKSSIGDKKETTNDTKCETPTLTVESDEGVILAVPPPPPPVIMVSTDDVLTENEECENNADDNETNANNANGKSAVVIEEEETPCRPPVTIQKPASLNLKGNTCTDDFTSAPTLESAMTDPSEVESESQKVAGLTLCMALTFILTVLPVLITEALRHSLSIHSFVNIRTCTVAVSTIQTIAYPNILMCADDVIHKAVHKLKTRIKRYLTCTSKLDPQHTHVEDTSSTSQV